MVAYARSVGLLNVLWLDTNEMCSADDQTGEALDGVAEGEVRSNPGK